MFLCKCYPLKPISLWVAGALMCSNTVFALAPDQTQIQADQVTGTAQTEVQAKGNVKVLRNDQTLDSDWLRYFQQENRAQAGDQFTLKQGEETTICGSTLDYYLDQRTGQAENTTFESEQEGKRVQGTGEQVIFLGKNQYQLNRSSLNTCKPGDSSWYISSPKIELDRDKNVGVAHNAKVVFKGVPILYTPWIDFPLDGGRKSGFLAPTFSVGQDAYVEVPYYFNIAPNYDATLTPRYFMSRGLMLGGQFRYLQPQFGGQMAAQYLMNDQKTKKDRYLWSGIHNQQISSDIFPVNLNVGYNVTQVSDDNYFEDFGDRMEVAANVNLNREAWMNSSFMLGPGNALTSLRVQRYQTLQNDERTRDKPYARLPEVKFTYNQNIIQGNFSLNTEMTRFHASGKQNGDRFVAYPEMTWDFNNQWGFFRPKVGLHYTQYQLDRFEQNKDRSKSRSLPIFSADTGLVFERDSVLAKQSHTQTLEPRLFYTYIPGKRQDDLPNFDSSENDFNFTQLFRENRFSGQDRINSANQLTTALTTRYINNENGLERLKLTIGQRFYFKKEDMSLSGEIHDRDKMGSDSLLEAGGDLTKNWRLDSFYHYNQALGKTERFSSALNYHPEKGKIVSLRYLYDREEEIYSNEYGRVSQVDLGVQWPVAKNYNVVARQNYSFADGISLEQLLGLEYREDCWAIRVVGQRYVTDRDKTKTGFFVQLELGSLGGLGNDPYDMLRLAIPGYSKIYEGRRK